MAENEKDHAPDQEVNLEGEVIVPEEKPINPNSYIPVMEEMEKIFGDEYFDNKAEKVKDNKEVFDCTLLGILFSAGWGSPCRIFYKDLIDIYNQMNEGEKVFEIIQVSFDHTEEEFKKAIAGLPWKFLPIKKEVPKEEKKEEKIEGEDLRTDEEKERDKKLEEERKKERELIQKRNKVIEGLEKKFNVLTIPKFFPIDKKGNVLSETGREDLLEYGVDICEKWNEDARVEVENENNEGNEEKKENEEGNENEEKKEGEEKKENAEVKENAEGKENAEVKK